MTGNYFIALAKSRFVYEGFEISDGTGGIVDVLGGRDT